MDKISSINFKAKPINKIAVQKYSKSQKSFLPLKTTFVKLDSESRRDLLVVEYAAAKWKDAKYIQKIATATHWMNNLPIDVYALTTQEKNFDKLILNKILGFAEMRPDDNDSRFVMLHYLQVKPEAISSSRAKVKNYNNVGSSILSLLKKVYKNISLFSEDIPATHNFYRKNKFIRDQGCYSRYLWSSNPFMRLRIHYENFRKGVGI